MTADTGLLTSPGFGSGNQYENEVTCLWVFDVPYDYFVHLEFHTVEMEDSYQCLKDGILVRSN